MLLRIKNEKLRSFIFKNFKKFWKIPQLKIIYHLDRNEIRLQDLFKNLETIFSETRSIIHSDRNTTKKVEFDNRFFAIKSFKVPHFLQRVSYANFRKPKAQRSFENSLKLINAGVHSPRPIGYFIQKKKLQIFQSFYVCEFHKYNFDFVSVFEDFKSNLQLVEDFLKTIIIMHNNDIYHHDLTVRNILVKTNSSNKFSIIDNNRMSFKKLNLKMRMESISKLTIDHFEREEIARMYSRLSGYNFEQCHRFIEEGYRKRVNYIKAKNFLKGK